MRRFRGALALVSLVACGGGGSPTAGNTPLPTPTPTPPPVGTSLAEIEAAGGPATAWAEAFSASLTVRVDPAHECLEGRYAACTQWWPDGSTITRAELIFDSADFATEPLLTAHMVGYAFGLQEWGESGAVMNPDWNRRGSSYHEVERNAIHMMYQHRNPGNLLPDRDPAFTPAAGARARQVRVEERPR